MSLAAEPEPPDLPEWVYDLEGEERDRVFKHLKPDVREALLEKLEEHHRNQPWEPQPHQLPPPEDEDWEGWMILAGRGAGKTAAVTHAMNEHAEGPPCLHGRIPHRMGIIAPTLGDASASIVHGDDGLSVINPRIREVGRRGGTVVLWPNGAEAHLFGVHTRRDVDRLRAKGNRCFDLFEELAAFHWLRDGVDQAEFGRRKGKARWIAATTPKPRPTIRALDKDPLVRVSRATTADNKHLSKRKRARLYDRYGNTLLGQQELQGLILADTSGALWTQELIEQHRVLATEVPRLIRIRTYVDPSWGTTNDECGIVVCGLGINRHVYVLEDLSKRTTPDEWAKIAALGYMPPPKAKWPVDSDGKVIVPEPREWYGRRSERIVAEKNFQGVQVEMAMKLAATDLEGMRLLIGWAIASVGKRLRAEPVFQAYEQGRVHHVGRLDGLEFQMCVARGAAVATEDGELPVEQVTAGTRVLTRQGYRRVLWAGQTATRSVVTIRTTDGELRCTADHPIWVEGKGFIAAGATHPGDSVLTCRSQPGTPSLTSMASGITGERTTGISRPTPATEEGYSTEPSMSTSSGRSHRATMSTIRTTTAATTTRATSKRSPVASTESAIRGRRVGKRGRSRSAVLSAKPIGRPRNRTSASARSVASRFIRQGPVRPSVVVSVGDDTTNAVDVFDLVVEDAHEFFADGVLVHNCNWVPPEARDRGDEGEGDPEPAPETADGEEIDPSNWSPDRLDAMVFGVTDLLLGRDSGVSKIISADGRLPRPAAGQSAGQATVPKIGNIPKSTPQGRLLARQLKDRRYTQGQR